MKEIFKILKEIYKIERRYIWTERRYIEYKWDAREEKKNRFIIKKEIFITIQRYIE